MTAYPIPNPFSQWVGLTGLPLTGAKIYIGVAGDDPETNPIAVYQDAGLTIPLAQPIRTAGGYLAGTGTPANAYPATTPYSIKVCTSANVQIYYLATVRDPIADLLVYIFTTQAASGGSALLGWIQSGTGAVARTVQDKLRDPIQNVRDFGAATDGTTNARSAFVLADAIGPLIVPRGSYLISTSLTITNDIGFAPGAKLVIPTGVTVTINGNLTAGVHQIFQCAGTGKVVLNPAKNLVGYPEWWGAVSNGPDCLTAILACYTACPVTQLQATDYYISATLKLQVAHRELKGFSKQWGALGDSSRLILTSGTLDAIQIGPDSNPGGGANTFLQEVFVHDFSVVRSIEPAGVSNLALCPAGIRTQFTLYTRIENVWASEHSHAFLFSGVVNCRVVNCYGIRAGSGTNPSSDPATGFFYDNTANIGAAGGNASLYLNACNFQIGGTPALTISAAAYGFGGWTDWFIDQMETAGVQYGFYGDATGATDAGTQDLRLRSPTFDTCSIAGIHIANAGPQTAINIVDPYVALGTSGATVAGINLSAVQGVVSIIGGQVLGGINAGDTGIKLTNCKGVSIDGTIIREAHTPVAVSGCTNCEVSPLINNPASGAPNGAVYLSGTNSRIYIAPGIEGGTGVFSTAGVNLSGTGTTSSTVDVSRIDKNSCNGAIGLGYNGTTISVAGAFGTTNLAQGNFN